MKHMEQQRRYKALVSFTITKRFSLCTLPPNTDKMINKFYESPSFTLTLGSIVKAWKFKFSKFKLVVDKSIEGH